MLGATQQTFMCALSIDGLSQLSKSNHRPRGLFTTCCGVSVMTEWKWCHSYKTKQKKGSWNWMSFLLSVQKRKHVGLCWHPTRNISESAQQIYWTSNKLEKSGLWMHALTFRNVFFFPRLGPECLLLHQDFLPAERVISFSSVLPPGDPLREAD